MLRILLRGSIDRNYCKLLKIVCEWHVDVEYLCNVMSLVIKYIVFIVGKSLFTRSSER